MEHENIITKRATNTVISAASAQAFVLGVTISPKCSTEALHDQSPWRQIRLLSRWKTENCVADEHKQHLSQKPLI